MAKVKFTLKNVDREIRKAEKKLHVLRGKVIKGDQRKIELNLKALKKSHGTILSVCRPATAFGQTFTTKK
jgi:hypothetical protein